jgi:hypothetical protein
MDKREADALLSRRGIARALWDAGFRPEGPDLSWWTQAGRRTSP